MASLANSWRVVGHATLEASDLKLVERALPKTPSWPRWLLVGLVVGVVVRVCLKDMEMGWSRALQIYFFSIASVLLGMAFGLGRWLSVRPSPEEVMAKLGLVSNVLTVELDQEGLVYGAQTKRAWREFHRFDENDTVFVLHGAELLQMIPKRAFALDDMHRARELMLARVRRR